MFEFCGVKIGLLICYDVEFGVSVRTLSLSGAQLILVPTACNIKKKLEFYPRWLYRHVLLRMVFIYCMLIIVERSLKVSVIFVIL